MNSRGNNRLGLTAARVHPAREVAGQAGLFQSRAFWAAGQLSKSSATGFPTKAPSFGRESGVPTTAVPNSLKPDRSQPQQRALGFDRPRDPARPFRIMPSSGCQRRENPLQYARPARGRWKLAEPAQSSRRRRALKNCRERLLPSFTGSLRFLRISSKLRAEAVFMANVLIPCNPARLIRLAVLPHCKHHGR